MSWKDVWTRAGDLSSEDRGELVCRLLRGCDVMGLEALLRRLEDEHGARPKAPPPTAAMLDALRPRLAPEPARPSSFDVMLLEAGPAKIRVIKELRGLTGLGLREAKARVDAAPTVVLTGLEPEAAERACGILEESGAAVRLRPAAEEE